MWRSYVFQPTGFARQATEIVRPAVGYGALLIGRLSRSQEKGP